MSLFYESGNIDSLVDGDGVYTIKEVAKIMEVSERTVYRQIKEGKILAVGGNGQPYLIFKEAFHEYLMEYEQSRKLFKKTGPKFKED